MKKKLIKRLEELAIENEIQKQEISKLNNMLGKEEEKESVTVSIKHNDTNTEWTYDILISEDYSIDDVAQSIVKQLDAEIIHDDLVNKEPKEEEVWWLCTKKNSDINFTGGKKYKQTGIGFDCLNLIDDNGKERTIFGYNNWFTKIEENKELEEAKMYLHGYMVGAYPIKPKLKKSIETILKHLEK